MGRLALRSMFGYCPIRSSFGNGRQGSASSRASTPVPPTTGLSRGDSMALTKRQREILTYLGAYAEQNGYAPSFEEIARQFNYNSLATVHEHLTNLERKGYIKRAYNE